MRRARRLPSAAGLQIEGVLLLGGLRAVLQQVAHPAVGHGVAEHGDFVADPLARLRGTLVYVFVVAAGDDAARARITERVHRLHAPVVSRPGEQPGYDANGPGLQLWVTLTLADTALRIAEAVWGRLPQPLVEEFLARMGAIGTALGMPAERWPADRASFELAVERGSAVLALDPVTRPVVEALFHATHAPWWFRLPLPFLVAATLPTLPALRAELEPLVPVRVPDLLPLARRLAPAYRALPAPLRRLPARLVLAAERRTAARRARVGDGT